MLEPLGEQSVDPSFLLWRQGLSTLVGRIAQDDGGLVAGAAVVVSVVGLRKAYGSTRAVDGVSFEVGEGEILGIVGPNGAGKTTTVECLEGLRAPDGGAVRVLGLDPAEAGGCAA